MVQNRVGNGCLAADLVHQALLTPALIIVPLVDDHVPVDVASLVWDALPLDDLHAHYIVLVELSGPPLWNPVLDLILDHGLVGTLGEGLRQRLLMQLIKLVVKLGDHVLDVS